MARTNAVEFESIYAVSHPGRARLHRFGIFGGSNGYWRTDLLRQIRMHGFMLTEDIDSSLRVVENGGRIASDPGLISRELAPTTLTALWNQRMRWAQGWFQVSLFARRLAAPEIRRQRRWFWRYLLVSSFFYTEMENVIVRVAQLKEFQGEREWKVTPRPPSGPSGGGA